MNQKPHKPTNMRLCNEVSEEHLNMLKYQGLTVQLVLPCHHRQNLAEYAIQTHKNHLMAGISGADPSFPMKIWDTFILQEKITINLL